MHECAGVRKETITTILRYYRGIRLGRLNKVTKPVTQPTFERGISQIKVHIVTAILTCFVSCSY
jgi:hypothetical protein